MAVGAQNLHDDCNVQQNNSLHRGLGHRYFRVISMVEPS